MCSTCQCNMNYYKNNSYLDKNLWRWRKDGDNPHDNKINIRKKSVIEDIKADIRLIYFIIFHNFALNASINQAFKISLEFSKDLKIKTISKRNISKIYI